MSTFIKEPLITYLKKKYGEFEVFFDLPERGSLAGEVRGSREIHLCPDASLNTLLHEIGHIRDKKWENATLNTNLLKTLFPIALIITSQVLMLAFNKPSVGIALSPLVWVCILFSYFRIWKPSQREKEMRCDIFAEMEYQNLIDEGIVRKSSRWRQVRWLL